MVLCRFWAQGNCRKGDSCNFEHSGQGSTAGGNRFSALGNNTPNNAFGGGRGGNAGSNADKYKPNNSNHLFGVDPELIKLDLTTDRPEWPFSCYGPGTRAPLQLIDGLTYEQSFEEIRLINYQAELNNTVAAVRAQEGKVLAEINEKVKLCVQKPQDAANYVINGKDSPDNRINQTFTDGKPPQNQALNQPNNAFASAPQAAAPFGQAGGFQSRQPVAFGSSSMPGQTSAFNRPGALASAAVFGQASQPGSSAFGQQQNHSAGSAFNRPAGFAQTSGFGAPSAQGTSSAFGQPSALGSNQQPAFGKTSQPASGFAQTQQAGQASAFGASQPQNATFGVPSQTGAAPGFAQQAPPSQGAIFNQAAQNSAFGSGTSGFGQSPRPNPFAAQPAASQPASGSSAQQASSAPGFGGQNASAPQSPFQQNTASASAQPIQGFGQTAGANTSGQTQPQANGFATSTQNAAQSGSSNFPVPTNDVRTKFPNGNLKSFRNQPVNYQVYPEDTKADKKPLPFYKPKGNDWERIFIETIPGSMPDTEPKITNTTDMAELTEAYKFAVETGKFKDGIMPELPPKREWISYNL